MKKLIILIIVLLVTAPAISACGVKGKLYLPDEESSSDR